MRSLNISRYGGAVFRHRFPNGDVFEGEFDLGDTNVNGTGTMTYANGDVYVGDWMDWEREGYGIITYANGDIYNGYWRDDVPAPDLTPDYHLRDDDDDDDDDYVEVKKVKEITPRSFIPFPKRSVSNLPSKVIDMENDEWSLSLSGIDGNQKDVPIVFLAGNELFVYTKSRLLNELLDDTSVVYESKPEGRGVILDVQYFNLRKLFHTLTGDIVPVKLLENIILSGKKNKKTAVRQRYNSVTDQLNRIVAESNIDFATKKKNIQTILKDHKLPPTIYQFVPFTINKVIQKIDRIWSKACAEGQAGSYVSGLHGQDMGGMQWTIHTIEEVVNRRKKTLKKGKVRTRSARTKSRKSRKSKSAKTA